MTFAEIDADSKTNRDVLKLLQRRWWGLTAVTLMTWLLFYIQLRGIMPNYANRWLLFSGVALIYVLWVAWSGLSENHREGESDLLPTLGWGNGLTLMRGLAIGLVAGFLFSPWPQGGLAWLPVLLYTLADVADYLDGYLARVTNHATQLGGRLDMEYDGLGMAVVSVLGVWYGQLPTWYLILGTARYWFVLGIWWRQRQGKPINELHPSVHRRVFAGFQMGFMSAVLWPIMPPAAAMIAGTLFGIPTILGFARDWLVVSDHLDPTHPTYKKIQGWLVWLMRRWLPPILRMVLPICIGLMFGRLQNWIRPLPWQMLLESWGVPIAVGLTTYLGVSAWVALGMMMAGVMPRLMSLVIVFPIGFDIASQGIGWATGIGLGCAICLMLLGSGPWSLWPIEEQFIMQRAGDVE